MRFKKKEKKKNMYSIQQVMDVGSFIMERN